MIVKEQLVCVLSIEAMIMLRLELCLWRELSGRISRIMLVGEARQITYMYLISYKEKSHLNAIFTIVACLTSEYSDLVLLCLSATNAFGSKLSAIT